MENGAKEFNVPAFRENRRLVALKNGGLHDPSVLVFKSSWSSKSKVKESEKFDYPQTSMIQRPSNDEDIAFMSVSFIKHFIIHWLWTSNEFLLIQ